ncbi:hypothetical protein [Aquimarina agarivorans]|uniref:hypothetical protein n=1 Tax=Aquimarina agarivorans TaxID=980584 RepID=UPI000248ED3C|nr:hypothetical protein [Aquimarina agarivorans]
MLTKNIIYFLIYFLTIGCNSKQKNSVDKSNSSIDLNITEKPSQKNSFIIRNKNENLTSFVEKFKNKIYGNNTNYSLNHQIIESNNWLDGKSTIIVFIDVPKEDEYEDYISVEGYMLFSVDKINYNKIKIDTYNPEGNQAIIKSIFFADSQKSKTKDLVVISSWKQSLKNTTEGTIYETRFYRKVNQESKLIYLQEISKHFGTSFDGQREGEKLSAKFKTPSEIKSELKRIGY